MFGNRHDISINSLTQDSVRCSALHALTLAVFLLGMISQGFRPCPHHTSLDPSGHAPPAGSTGAVLGGMPDGHGTPAGSESESEDREGICSCLEGCGTESEESLLSGQFHTQRPFFTAAHVVERPARSLLDTRQNGYLVPLPQPPPNSSIRSS